MTPERWIAFMFLLAGWVGLMVWVQPPTIVNILLSLCFGFVCVTILARVYR